MAESEQWNLWLSIGRGSLRVSVSLEDPSDPVSARSLLDIRQVVDQVVVPVAQICKERSGG